MSDTPTEPSALRDDEKPVDADLSPETAAPTKPALGTVDPILAEVGKPTPPPRPARTGMTLLVGMVLGAAVAGGVGYFVQSNFATPPVFDTSALESRLTAAEAEAAGLRAEIARLSEAAMAPSTPDNAILDRLATLEATPAPDLAPLTARLDQLESNIAALANLPSETGVSPAALAAMQAEIAALKSQKSEDPSGIEATASAIEARLQEVETRAGELTAQANAISVTAARNAALGQIAAALDSGLPYAAAISALADTEVPVSLSAFAETGVPTLVSLREAFPSAARLALEQALRSNAGEGWADRVAVFLRNQTGARSLTPREGSDPDAVLSRAEAALATGDVSLALTELSALPAEAQAALSEWTALAQRRLDAQSALAGLMKTAGQ